MRLDLYQVDAFSAHVFGGNPAAVCPLQRWPADELMQRVAMENNLSETAFFVQEDQGFRLRWFTPAAEVDLCGHATLAAAHVLFSHLDYGGDSLRFLTRSGPLTVRRSASGNGYVMNFPSKSLTRATPPPALTGALGDIPVDDCYRADDYLLVVQNEDILRACRPDFNRLQAVDTRGVIVTAPADDETLDFVSRFFAPAVGVNEDPVTGSAHTMLAPYWGQRLGKTELQARQVSKRGGNLHCRLTGEGRVDIRGPAVTYLEGTIEIPDL